jgi:hypothetical protein
MKKLIFTLLFIPLLFIAFQPQVHARTVTFIEKGDITGCGSTKSTDCNYAWTCSLEPDGWSPDSLWNPTNFDSVTSRDGWSLNPLGQITVYNSSDKISHQRYYFAQGYVNPIDYPPNLTLEVGEGDKAATIACQTTTKDSYFTKGKWETRGTVQKRTLWQKPTASLSLSQNSLTLSGPADGGDLTGSVELTYMGCNSGGGFGGGISWTGPKATDGNKWASRLIVDWGTEGDYGDTIDCKNHTTKISLKFNPLRVDPGQYDFLVTFYLKVM